MLANSLWRVQAVAVGRNVVVLFADLPAGVAFRDPTGEALNCSGVDVGRAAESGCGFRTFHFVGNPFVRQSDRT